MENEKKLTYEERIKNKLDKAFVESEKSFIGFFIKNYRFTYLLIFIVLIGGLYSALTIPKESEPEVKVPYAVVTTIYPGANPVDVEELITKKIEKEIENLDNLNKYNSTSGQGFSSVFVEFEAEANLDESFRKLREAASDAESKLPQDAENPVVTEVNFNDTPIVTYSLVGNYSEVELKSFADDIKEEFENIKDVSEATIIGGLEKEFQIIVDQTKLANFNVSLGQIAGAIQVSNFSLPAGNIEIDGFNYGIRVKGRFNTIEDLNDIVVTTYQNEPIFLRDLAVIKEGYKEKNSESRIGFPGVAAQNAISLQIHKKTGGNILNIVADSEKLVKELYTENKLPENLRIEKTNDNSFVIRDDLRILGSSAIQTIILINLILLLILSFRGALITAMSVPLAFFTAFFFLKIEDMTLNSMVLFSLVISLGLMVDNAIIIIEGVNEYVSEHKKSIYEAAILSVWNYKWAITAGTMTTVAAFMPMLIVSGILGQYLSILPKTISVTLVSSLFVALIIIPTLATRFIKAKSDTNKEIRTKKRHLYINERMDILYRNYEKFLNNVLFSKKKRRMLIASAWILFLLAVSIPVFGLMRIEMFPKVNMDFFVINIKLPVGSTLEETSPIASEVEEIVSKIPELENYVSNIGSSASLGFDGGVSSGEHLANITVNLSKKEERKRKSYEIADSLRDELKKIQGAEIQLEELSAGPPTGSPIEIRVYGDDLKKIAEITDILKGKLDQIPEVINKKDSLEESAGEFVFGIDKQKANYYGLSITSIASTLRNAVYGSSVSSVNVDGEDVDITVKYNKDSFSNIKDLENILLFLPNGENISVKEVAKIELEPSLLSIKRRDGQRIATISADLEKGADLKLITEQVTEEINKLELEENFKVVIGGEVEDITKSFKETFYSMILAVVLIAFILVLQFNSFRQPMIIIFSLPLAIIGVIFGLRLVGQPFSFPAFIGIVALAGIVVNDAIVLIDRINKNIKDGIPFEEAIIQGGLTRMKPIFLTSITTIAGIFPLIYANEIWRGLSLTVIFGLIFSTVLTLIVIPTIYAGVCKKERDCK